ncbi:DUF6402 family protein [Pyxidicoccus caerfyrddinensis]|uniref:DUF6402 family protein n=1 Tax=Pyxidicoccus caerfyrddinensis TaxID=2709663 RepID=UPI0013DBFAF8|nr:DUF6402 family protein [Pyxidicoccus caerfyrddinensis]
MADQSSQLQELAKTKMAAGDEKEAEKLELSDFKLTDIPKVMDALSWKEAARFQRKWFDAPAYELPRDYKTGKKDARTLDKSHVVEDLSFDWLMSASKRAKPEVDELIAEFSDIREYSHRVGKVKGILSTLSPGLIVLLARMDKMGLVDTKRMSLKEGFRDFGDLPAIELEYTSQFNFIPMSADFWSQATDKMDDVYGALGAFSLKIAATTIRTHFRHKDFPALEIDELGFYVRDTFEFTNTGKDQPLGYWSKKGVRKPGPIDYLLDPDYIDHDDVRYFKVTNNSYNDYRNKWKKGGDFMVFSTVKKVPVSIQIHIDRIDIQEYLDRKKDLGL